MSVPCILDHSIPCSRLLWPSLRQGSCVLLGWRRQRGGIQSCLAAMSYSSRSTRGLRLAEMRSVTLGDREAACPQSFLGGVR